MCIRIDTTTAEIVLLLIIKSDEARRDVMGMQSEIGANCNYPEHVATVDLIHGHEVVWFPATECGYIDGDFIDADVVGAVDTFTPAQAVAVYARARGREAEFPFAYAWLFGVMGYAA